MGIGERIRALRTERGLSQEEVARRTGVSLGSYGDIERGVTTDPHYSTLRGISHALGVPIERLLQEEPAPLAEAPREAGPANVHPLFAEDQARAAWQRAFDESRRFRSQAKMRLGEQLSLWEAAKHEEASYEERREFLDAMGRILDEASGVSRKLMQNLGEGLGRMAEPSLEGTPPDPYWTECQKADTLDRELFGMVGEAGLSVHPKKTEEAPGQWRCEVLEAA